MDGANADSDHSMNWEDFFGMYFYNLKFNFTDYLNSFLLVFLSLPVCI